MPPVIVGAAISAGIGAGLTGAAFGALFVQNLALGLVASALAPKPPKPQRRDNTVTSREPVASRKVVYGRTRVGGTIVYLESTGSDNKYLHLIVAVAGHEIDAFEKVYFGDTLVWDGGTYQDGWDTYARLNFHEGEDDQTADADLVSESSHWTADHRLRGVAYIYARLEYNQDRFPNGIPNITTVIRGKKVFDPRSSTTAFSSNPALCVRDFLLDDNYGLGVSSDEINAASINSAANLCEESVATTSGFQDRYTLDGVVDTGSTPKDNLEGMLTSCAGSIVYSGGEFFMFVSAYKTPTITLDESVVTGSISVQTKKSRRELFNSVKGIFSSEDDNYILTDYPAIESSAYQTEDGDEIYLDVDLPYTTNPIRAERIAKLSLLRTRQQITATIPCNLSALRLKAGDTVMISNTRFGWSSKVFEIINLRLSADDSGALGVELQVIETAAAVYDWTTGDEIDFVAGQATTLAAPGSVIAPTNVALNQGSVVQADNTTRPTLTATWTNNDAFASQFEVKFGIVGETQQTLVTRNEFFEIPNVDTGETYQIQVRAINRLGAQSAFAPTTPVTQSGGAGSLSGTKIIDATIDTPQVASNAINEVLSTTASAVTSGGVYVTAPFVTTDENARIAINNGNFPTDFVTGPTVSFTVPSTNVPDRLMLQIIFTGYNVQMSQSTPTSTGGVFDLVLTDHSLAIQTLFNGTQKSLVAHDAHTFFCKSGFPQQVISAGAAPRILFFEKGTDYNGGETMQIKFFLHFYEEIAGNMEVAYNTAFIQCFLSELKR